MKMIITGKKVELDQVLREYIERQVYFALSRFSPRVAHIDVKVEDINGPRGGIDKRCCIMVKLKRSGKLTVEGTDTDLSSAVSTAANRAGRMVQRELERRRTRGRKPPNAIKQHNELEG